MAQKCACICSKMSRKSMCVSWSSFKNSSWLPLPRQVGARCILDGLRCSTCMCQVTLVRGDGTSGVAHFDLCVHCMAYPHVCTGVVMQERGWMAMEQGRRLSRQTDRRRACLLQRGGQAKSVVQCCPKAGRPAEQMPCLHQQRCREGG